MIYKKISESPSGSCDFCVLGGAIGRNPALRPTLAALGGIREFVARQPDLQVIAGLAERDDVVALKRSVPDLLFTGIRAKEREPLGLIYKDLDMTSAADMLSNRAFSKIWHNAKGNAAVVEQIRARGPPPDLVRLLQAAVGTGRSNLSALLISLRSTCEHTVHFSALRSYASLFPAHFRLEAEALLSEPVEYFISMVAPAQVSLEAEPLHVASSPLPLGPPEMATAPSPAPRHNDPAPEWNVAAHDWAPPHLGNRSGGCGGNGTGKGCGGATNL
jgi:hypothetical protein